MVRARSRLKLHRFVNKLRTYKYLLSGLTTLVKQSVLSLLEDNYWMGPKKIEIKLNKWSSNEKHRSKIDVLPTLEQIQNFAKHQRIKNCNFLKIVKI